MLLPNQAPNQAPNQITWVPRLPLSFSTLDLQRILSVLSLSIEFFLLYPKRLLKKRFLFLKLSFFLILQLPDQRF